MDTNEISFDAVFRNDEFKIYESDELLAAFKKLNDVLESYITDAVIRTKIETAALDCSSAAQRSSFEQGFCFAVKLFKAIMKI